MQLTNIRLSGLFSDSYLGLGTGDESSPAMYFNLAPNQQLIIETIAAVVSVASTQSAQAPFITLFALEHRTGNTLAEYPLPLQFQASFDANPDSTASSLRNWWSMDQRIKGYVPWGGRLVLEGYRGPTFEGDGRVDVTITAYIDTAIRLKFPFFRF